MLQLCSSADRREDRVPSHSGHLAEPILVDGSPRESTTASPFARWKKPTHHWCREVVTIRKLFLDSEPRVPATRPLWTRSVGSSYSRIRRPTYFSPSARLN